MKTLLQCLLFCSLVAPIRGAESDSNATDHRSHSYGMWVQFGVGYSTEGMTARAGAFVSKDDNFLALRVGGGGDVALFGTSANKYSEYGLMYGRRLHLVLFEPYIAGGLAYTYCRVNDVNFFKPGIILETNLSTSLMLFGVGLTAFVNINPTIVVSGLIIEVRLGMVD